MDNKKELIVSAIENGTVIDHIPADAVYRVASILELSLHDDEVIIGTNLMSKKLGKKGIIKIKNKYFKQNEIDKIAVAAPFATLIEIRDSQKVVKRSVEIPDVLHAIVKCINPNCITNVEDVPTKFTVIEKNPLKIHCHYCEKTQEPMLH
ncbi:MAG: aspartate carbamoyltransferase regulatory subunit [Bacteroidales bacterium]|jgi:aspartate carbamoyltransferase regulatory subunit|nr:aspartate carbamoyltransferase regulatory subunit [Bacteroidales bacterium]